MASQDKHLKLFISDDFINVFFHISISLCPVFLPPFLWSFFYLPFSLCFCIPHSGLLSFPSLEILSFQSTSVFFCLSSYTSSFLLPFTAPPLILTFLYFFFHLSHFSCPLFTFLFFLCLFSHLTLCLIHIVLSSPPVSCPSLSPSFPLLFLLPILVPSHSLSCYSS